MNHHNEHYRMVEEPSRRDHGHCPLVAERHSIGEYAPSLVGRSVFDLFRDGWKLIQPNSGNALLHVHFVEFTIVRFASDENDISIVVHCKLPDTFEFNLEDIGFLQVQYCYEKLETCTTGRLVIPHFGAAKLSDWMRGEFLKQFMDSR